MAAKKRPARHRVGRVSYYQHHGSWYLYFRDTTGIHRPRIGRSEADAERAAALKNAELTTGEVSMPQQLVIAPPAPLAAATLTVARSWRTWRRCSVACWS